MSKRLGPFMVVRRRLRTATPRVPSKCEFTHADRLLPWNASISDFPQRAAHVLTLAVVVNVVLQALLMNKH